MTPLHNTNINTMMLLAMVIATMLVSTSAFQGRGWSTTSGTTTTATTTTTTTTTTTVGSNEATIALNFPKYQAQYNKYFTCPIMTRESIHRSAEDRILQQQHTQHKVQQQHQQQQHQQQHHTKLATAEVHLVDVEWLKPHEQVVGETHVNELLKATLRWGAYVAPLLVDRVTGAILDGHHRYHVGMRLGLQRVPAVLVDYAADTSIDVDVWEGCGRNSLTKQEVLEMALSGGVFPPKTSKHSFSDSLPPVLVPLAILQQNNFLRHKHSVPRIPHREAQLDYHI
eukprot:scaffold8690_cov190-Amphora_coffeaeformis.AAC.2